MLAVTLFAVGSSLDSSARQSTSITPTRSVVQDYFRAQSPLGAIDAVRWLRLLEVNVSSTVSGSTRFPAGGRFDYEPVEIAKVPGASPR